MSLLLLSQIVWQNRRPQLTGLFPLLSSDFPFISTLDSMAASHILEGRSRAERGEVIFILEEVEGESSADEQVSHGTEGVRSVQSGRQQNRLERIENPKASLNPGARNAIRQHAQPARRFCDSQGKGGQKSKHLAFLLVPFPSPRLPSVMITGFSCGTS